MDKDVNNIPIGMTFILKHRKVELGIEYTLEFYTNRFWKKSWFLSNEESKQYSREHFATLLLHYVNETLSEHVRSKYLTVIPIP